MGETARVVEGFVKWRFVAKIDVRQELPELRAGVWRNPPNESTPFSETRRNCANGSHWVQGGGYRRAAGEWERAYVGLAQRCIRPAGYGLVTDWRQLPALSDAFQSTGGACLISARRFVGVEYSEAYCEVAAERLEAAATGKRVRQRNGPADFARDQSIAARRLNESLTLSRLF